MLRHRLRSSALTVLGCILAWLPALAQSGSGARAGGRDSLRVLRFQPDSAATPVAPVVITFDRPVAPNLDESIAPESLLKITPVRPHRAYWRDPSTLVAEFDQLWAPGASYTVTLSPSLRTMDGTALARRAPWRVRVQSARLVEIVPVGAVYQETRDADPAGRIQLIYSAPVSAGELDGRIWFVPSDGCASRDSVRLAVVAVRRVAADDAYPLKEAGGYDRDRRLDSLRRVVEVRAERPPPRGCVGVVRTRTSGSEPRRDWSLRIAPVMSLTEIVTYTPDEEMSSCGAGRCEAGVLTLRFSQPVTTEELLAHVRIDGRAPRVSQNAMVDTLHAGGRLRVSVDASLRSRYGERLGRSLDTVLSGWQRTPALGFAKGQVALPRRAPQLLRIRYASTDSVRVVIARVADTSRSRAMAHLPPSFAGVPWWKLVSDSVVRVVPAHADSAQEGVLDVLPSWVPAGWRPDAILAIRAVPIRIDRSVKPKVRGTAMLPAVVASAASEGETSPRFAIAQRSDLAAHVVRDHDDVTVWVTRRGTAEPVRGAVVTIYARGVDRITSATTDSLGLARLRGIGARSVRDVEVERHAEVVAEGDRILAGVPRDYYRDDRDVPDSAAAAALASGARVLLHGAAFADRGIYRPAEWVHVKGIARAYRPDTGYRPIAGDSARLTLASMRGGSRETIATRAGRLGAFGTYSDSLQLPATAPVGWYFVTFEVRDRWGWRQAAEASVAVAEYRPPEFAVRATADTSAPLYAGDSATIHVEASYLFGPPMADATVQATVYTNDAWGTAPAFAALKGYQVGRSTWLDEERTQQPDQQPGPARLGADGKAVLRVPSRRLTRPGVLSVSVNVQDANRQTIAAYASVPLRTADAFVGIRTSESRWDWPAGKAIPLELVVVRGDGAMRPGTTIRLAAYRITWLLGHWQRDTVWRDSVTPDDGRASRAFVPPSSGWYEIVAGVRDERGRLAESGVYLGVMGPGWPAARGALTLKLDDRDVAPGDTVKAIIEAPAELTAWVVLDKRGLRWQRLAALKRGVNVVAVPVPPQAGGYVDLHVIATRAVETPAASGDNLPYFFHERQFIIVNDSVHALRVRVVTDRVRYQPRDSVRVAVTVTGRQGRGRQSELAVWAVDEGIVSLTTYRPPPVLGQLLRTGWSYWFPGSTLLGTLTATPPALGRLFDWDWSGRHPALSKLSASAFDARGEYASQSRVAQGLFERVDVGQASVPALRYRFSTTPFFAGTVATDANGNATTTFVLPDNVTTYRVFAVAVDAEVRSGSGDTTIVSTRPLIVRAALPRIVRRGDSLFAGALLTRERTAERSSTPVELTVRADGLRIDGAMVARDTLIGERALERRFSMHVLADDSVTVGFSALSPGEGDAVLTRLPVSAPGRPRARVAMGSLMREETVTLELPDDLDLTRSRLVLHSGQSPLPLLRELDERLRVYPYTCTEQLASAARALVARVRLERALGVATTLAPSDRKRLELTVNGLLERQRQDGGFGYWSARHWTTPWLTTHALDALSGARELGVSVPRGVFDRAAAYLGADSLTGDYLRKQWLSAADSAHWPHEALHAARLLRKLARPDTSLERQVWALRARLDFEDRLTLALLRAAAGDSASARTLVDDAWRSTAVDGRRVTLEDSVLRRRWLFRSVTAAHVALLRATAAVRPHHPQLAPLLESLLQSARSDAVSNWNTVDQSAVAEAIQSVVPLLGLGTSARVSVTDARGETVAREPAPGGADSVRLDLERFIVADGARRSLRVRLTSPSSTPTYFALTLSEVPVARPVRPDQEGIAVERWYERYEDGKPITEVREGELVRVRLRITAPRDREFVVIDDPLPAGLEAVDQSLRTTGSLPPYAGAPRLEGDTREGPVGQKWLYGSWDGGWWTPWEHKEIRDDRVLWFARQLWRGSYQASYVARATTAGLFVRPPAQAEEMYNPAVHGRSEGGLLSVRSSDSAPAHR